MIVVQIEGRPVPWQRPRARGKRFFDAQIEEKNDIRRAIKEVFEGPILRGPLCLTTEFYFKVPKNISKKNRFEMLSGKIPFTKRPDLSNLVKIIEDAANGFLWEDDSQIARLRAEKLYGTEEKTIIAVSQII
jgi:Holliday junction resolvase RusA-like endonuclease